MKISSNASTTSVSEPGEAAAIDVRAVGEQRQHALGARAAAKRWTSKCSPSIGV